jgi:tryptophan-rich sensory protein
MRRAATVIAFLVLVIGGGLLIGTVTRPDGWYAALAKPPFNPPNWIFAPVWTLLYVLIAFAGARTFERGVGTAFALWVAQLALNFAWSPVFFGLHQPGAALVVVAALLVAALAFIAERWSRDRVVALLFVPYAAWVAFATLLNAAIVVLN